MPRPPREGVSPEVRLMKSVASLTGWVNASTDEARRERLRKAHENGPPGIAFHARRLGLDPDNLTPAERRRVESARKLYFRQISLKGIQANKAKRAAAKRRRGDAP
jgi:hypothetical protein